MALRYLDFLILNFYRSEEGSLTVTVTDANMKREDNEPVQITQKAARYGGLNPTTWEAEIGRPCTNQNRNPEVMLRRTSPLSHRFREARAGQT